MTERFERQPRVGWFLRFGAWWKADRPTDNRFNWVELTPRSRAYAIREDERGRGVDLMSWTCSVANPSGR